MLVTRLDCGGGAARAVLLKRLQPGAKGRSELTLYAQVMVMIMIMIMMRMMVMSMMMKR
jgi:hypothetical protein